MKQAISLPYESASSETEKIDALEFARDHRSLDESMSLTDFQRLADVLLENEGVLRVKLEGMRDEEGVSWLSLAVEGSLVLTCQRCLGRLQLPLKLDNRLQLVTNQDDWSDVDLENDAFDILLAESPVSVQDLVEDEVILALPVSPMHENCDMLVSGSGGQEASPFAALAKLKKH